MPIKTRKANDNEFVPTATLGKIVADNYPECFIPMYENNIDGVLMVCICDGCEEAKPRLKELAQIYAVCLKSYVNKKGKIRPISDLFLHKKK